MTISTNLELQEAEDSHGFDDADSSSDEEDFTFTIGAPEAADIEVEFDSVEQEK